MRNKKILKQAEEHTVKKVMCLVNTLRESSNDVDTQELVNYPAVDTLVGFSLILQETLSSLDALASPANPSDALVFSSS